MPIVKEIFGLFLLLPLVTPLIAQDSFEMESAFPLTERCQYYNSSCNSHEENCPTTELCTLSDQKSKARCYVAWQNSTENGVTVTLKGCLYYDITCKETCVSNEKHNPTKTIYCCCYGDECNSEFAWDPKETIVDTTTHPTPTPTDDDVALITAVITICSLVVTFFIVSIVYYCYRKRKMNNFAELPTIETSTLTNSYPSPNMSYRPIRLLEVKAKGRFGAVWKAKHNDTLVAVKIFPLQDKVSWITEKRIFQLPQMNHSCVLQFIGVDKRGDGLNTEFWLITAYHEKGSLFDYLKGNTITWTELCFIGENMANGLAYLHGEQSPNKVDGLKPVVAHRDFKSKNILLKSDLTACIADFGLAITFYPGQLPGDTHGQVGTRRYMAPEVLEGAIHFHRDAFLPIDMYACGLVLWELASRCTVDGPIGEYKLPFEDEVGQHPSLDDMQECVVTRKKRPVFLKSWFTKPYFVTLIQMMAECWDHDAEARLSASCIVERFALLYRPPPPSRVPPGKDTV